MAAGAATIDFSPRYLEVEQGVLLRAGTEVTRIEEMGRPGLRVGVLDGYGADAFQSARLRSLQIVRVDGLDGLFADLAVRRIDMAASTKSRLFAEAVKLRGSRLLDGRLLVELIGMGVLSSRPAAAASYLAGFV